MENMRSKDFSQLPVMSNDREVDGVITWKSIGERASTGSPCQFVRECMERPAIVVDIDSRLLDATDHIANGYVLVRGEDGVITGIVTASDFAVQFRQLAEPFLVIEEIERHLRRLVGKNFSTNELEESAPKWRKRYVSRPDDLLLGSYYQLLEPPEHWKRLSLDICKRFFLEQLNSATNIRNKVMHFNPRGLEPEYLEQLNEFADRLRELTARG